MRHCSFVVNFKRKTVTAHISALGAICFDMAQRIFNIIIIAASCLIICFLSAVFFLGSKETFEELKLNLVGNFSLRAIGGIVLGLPTLLVLLIGNLIFNSRVDSKQKINLRKLLMVSALATSSAAILGTIFFFSRS
jgi:hypothetical protein